MQIGARVGVLLLGVVLMAYLTRHLGTAGYGHYAVAVVLMNWLGVTIEAATGGATVQLVAGQQHGSRYAVSMLQMVGCFATLLAIAVVVSAHLLAEFLRAPAIAPLLRILALDFALGAVAGIYASILVAQGRYVLSAVMALSVSATQLLVAFLLVERGFLASGACFAMVAASVVQLVVGRAATGVALFGRDRVPLGNLWGHTRLWAGAQLALRVTQSMDLLAVKFFAKSPSFVGPYAGGQNISQAAFMLFAPSQGVLLQSMAKSRRGGKHEEAAQTGALYLRGALAYGALLCALSILSEDIVRFLLGPAFSESAPVLMILLWAVAFRILAVTGRTLIAAVGERPSIVVPLVILIALGLIAYTVAIPRGGIVAGAAVALGMAVAASFTSLREGMKMMGIKFPWDSLAKIVLCALFTSSVAVALGAAGWWLLAKLTVECLVYLALLFLLNEWRPTDHQKQSIRKAIFKTSLHK